MRIYYPKHVSGALKLVWNFLQEGKELEHFRIIVYKAFYIALRLVNKTMVRALCCVFDD